MIFQIDPANGTPVYEQISRQIMFAVACGALKAGEMVPSVRQLARELVVNPNTVSRAYRALQENGIIESIRGTGMQVASGALRKCQSARKEYFKHQFRATIEAARHSLISDDDILAVFQAELKSNSRPPGKPGNRVNKTRQGDQG